MEAVACVVLNRARNPRWWGRDIISVCLKNFQFSTWNPDDSQRRIIMAVTTADRHFVIAREIAGRAIDGKLPDITNNADHFHTHAVRPLWSQGRKPVAIIGNHRFFRLELREPPKVKAVDKVDVRKVKRASHIPDDDILEAEDD